MEKQKTKPRGWWTTHPTLLTSNVHGLCDGNNDGLGDFKGLREHLHWFQSMGISGFRFQHVGAYGDDYKWCGLVQQDWYDVDPRYGGMAEFDKFMAACAERDMKVIMMAVPEYLGWQHPDYIAAKQAEENGENDPRSDWFKWNDDGTVLTCWDRPGPDVSNTGYMDAFIKHIAFWMDKGIAGWDTDAVGTWHNLNLDALRSFTGYVSNRGGFVSAENLALQHDITKFGGFNAGTGYSRHEFYNEIKAIREHKADYIREALKVRDQLIACGMFPYQQFGDRSNTAMTDSWEHLLEIFKLQVAFNAVLPDQVWILANGISFTEANYSNVLTPHNTGWGAIDWEAVSVQEKNYDSPFSHVKRLFSLRARHKELAIGEMEELSTNHHEEVFAALRTSEDGEEEAIVVFNFSNKPKDIVIQFGNHTFRTLRNYLNNEIVNVTGNSIHLKLNPFGYKFFKKIQ